MTYRQKDGESKGQTNRMMERQRYRGTGKQRQRDRHAERWRDKETDKRKDGEKTYKHANREMKGQREK